jgi:hypothetical protein
MSDSAITRSDVYGRPCLREVFPETDDFLGLCLIASNDLVSMMQDDDEVIIEVERLRDVAAALVRAAEFLEAAAKAAGDTL